MIADEIEKKLNQPSGIEQKLFRFSWHTHTHTGQQGFPVVRHQYSHQHCFDHQTVTKFTMKPKTILFSLFVLIGSMFTSHAQIDWGMENQKHVLLLNYLNLSEPFYRRDFTVTLLDWPNLYRRVTERFNSLENGSVYHTNLIVTHKWARWDNGESYTVTNAWRSYEVDGGPRIWVDMNDPFYGEHTSPKAPDIGTGSWTTNGYFQSISAKVTWWVTASPNNTVDRKLRLMWNTGRKDLHGNYLCYAHYRIPSNAVHYVITPIIAEMRGPFCDSLKGLNLFELELFDPPFVWGGFQDSWRWGTQDADQTCPASCRTATFTVNIPDPNTITNTWTNAQVAAAVEMSFIDPAGGGGGSLVLSPPPPPGGTGTNGSGSVTVPDMAYLKHLTFRGSPSRAYFIETSTNLVDWALLSVADEFEEGVYRAEDWRTTPPYLFYRISPGE